MLIFDYPLNINTNNSVSQDTINKYLSVYTPTINGSVNNGYFSGSNFSIQLKKSKYNQNYNLDTSPWSIEFDYRCVNPIENNYLIKINKRLDQLNNYSIYISYKNTYNPNGVTDGYFTYTIPESELNSLKTWRHYQIVYDNNIVYLYIDGNQKKAVRGFQIPTEFTMSSNSFIQIGNHNFELKNFSYNAGYKETIKSKESFYEFTSKVIVRPPRTNQAMNIKIPFPYKQFKDMNFFITDIDGKFISEKYYERIDDDTIHFSGENVYYLNLTVDDDIRFTFCHNKEFYHINKFEYTFNLTEGINSYKVPLTFGQIMDLNARYKIFYNRTYLDPEKNYNFSLYEAKLIFDDDFIITTGDEVSILVFYTGNKLNDTVADLPMSGYINLKRHEIDRNYNNDLLAIFVNGKLVDRENIIHMSNNMYKINKDIKSRYDLQVKCLSPKINELIPFYKTHSNMMTKPKQYQYQEFPCSCFIKGYDIPHGRYILDADLDPITIHDLLMIHKEYYISLVHHGVSEFSDKSIRYTINFYRDDFYPEPEQVSVIGQIKSINDYHEYVSDSPTALLIGKLPATMSQVLTDQVLMSTKIENIYISDTDNHDEDISGIICRLKILDNKLNIKYPIYYTLETTDYELNNYVNILEWVISTKKDGNGEIIYRKTINCFPYNNPYDDD